MDKLQSELQRVFEFNRIMGRPVGCRDAIFNQALYGVEEGIKELATAIHTKNRTLIRDALADTVVVAAGGVYLCGGDVDSLYIRGGVSGDVFHSVNGCVRSVIIANSDYFVSIDFKYVIECALGFSDSEDIDLISDLAAVNDSNFSKFCKDEAEAMTTISHYHNVHGVKAEYKTTGNADYPIAVFCAEAKGDFLKGKLLKSVNYREPVFL